MSLPTSEPLPSENVSNLAAARRRRLHRALLPRSDDEQTAWLEAVARQLTPSYDYFIACLLSGVTLAIALLLFSDALLVLGVLFAPFLGPVLGIALAAINGSGRYLLKASLSTLAAAMFVLGFGALAGALLPMLPLGPVPVFTSWTSYEWPNFLVLAVGVGLSVYMLVRSPHKRPLVANVAIAYGLFPPLTAAGFNLVAFNDSAWIAGINVAGVHLAWAVLVGILSLIILGNPPKKLAGFLLTGLALGVLAVAFITSPLNQGPVRNVEPTSPPNILSANPSPTVTITMTQTTTPQPVVDQPPTVTLTPTITFEPTETATQTITPQPTPVWARVEAPTGGGALLRDEPDGKILSSILNGNMLEVISDPVRGTSGTIWVKVRTENGFEGWVVQSLLATATPAPGW